MSAPHCRLEGDQQNPIDREDCERDCEEAEEAVSADPVEKAQKTSAIAAAATKLLPRTSLKLIEPALVVVTMKCLQWASPTTVRSTKRKACWEPGG